MPVQFANTVAEKNKIITALQKQALARWPNLLQCLNFGIRSNEFKYLPNPSSAIHHYMARVKKYQFILHEQQPLRQVGQVGHHIYHMSVIITNTRNGLFMISSR